MNWSDISVKQFQELALIEEDLPSIDKAYATISICKHIDIIELDAMSIGEVSVLAKECEFAYKQPFKNEKANRYKQYRFIRDITKIKGGVARYIEVKHFSRDHVENMHYVLASCVHPQRKTWYGSWVDVPYDAKNHEQYALDLQEMPITIALGLIGFFLPAFEILRKNLVHSSIQEQAIQRKRLTLRMMWRHKTTQAKAESIITPLWETLVGSTK